MILILIAIVVYVHNDYGDDDIIYDNSWKPNSLFLGKNISEYLPFISNNIIDKNFINDVKTFSYSYNNIIDYDFSRDCAINGKSFCLRALLINMFLVKENAVTKQKLVMIVRNIVILII